MPSVFSLTPFIRTKKKLEIRYCKYWILYAPASNTSPPNHKKWRVFNAFASMPLLASWSDWSRALEAAPLGGISTSGNRRKKLFSTSRIVDDVNKFHLKRRYFESNCCEPFGISLAYPDSKQPAPRWKLMLARVRIQQQCPQKVSWAFRGSKHVKLASVSFLSSTFLYVSIWIDFSVCAFLNPNSLRIRLHTLAQNGNGRTFHGTFQLEFPALHFAGCCPGNPAAIAQCIDV